LVEEFVDLAYGAAVELPHQVHDFQFGVGEFSF
jgi:hypothetical protein